MDEVHVRQIRSSSLLVVLCWILLLGQTAAYVRRDPYAMDKRAFPDVRGTLASKRSTSQSLMDKLDDVRGTLESKRSIPETEYNRLSGHSFNKRASGDFENDMFEKLQNEIEKAQLDDSQRERTDFEREQDVKRPFLDTLQQLQSKRFGGFYWPDVPRLQRRLYNQRNVLTSEQRDFQIDQDYPVEKRGPFDMHTVRGSLELKRARRRAADDII